ncbi:MAG: hypothetical protein ACFFER_11775, partial [Candidatus Thorarchaeota archaeon]
EKEVESLIGTVTLSCRDFSLIKVPITLPGGKSENRARGAIGLFQYLGSTSELEQTLQAIKKVCTIAMTKPLRRPFSNWSGFEIFLAERWSM